MLNIANLYFESHVTIEPVEGVRLKLFQEICKEWKFRVADLLLQDKLTPSKKDMFATGSHFDMQILSFRMASLLQSLAINKFVIYRYKIEMTLVDSKFKDEFGVWTSNASE